VDGEIEVNPFKRSYELTDTRLKHLLK